MIMHLIFAVFAFTQIAMHVAMAHLPALPAVPGPGTCNQFSDVCTKAQNGINTLVNVIKFLGGAMTILMIALSGILFLISRNNPKHQDSAKSALIWAVVGIAVLALAKPIADGITGIFGL